MTDKQKVGMPILSEQQKRELIESLEDALETETHSVYGYAARIALAALTAEPCYWEIEGHLFSTREEALYRGNRGTPEPLYEEPPSASLLEKDIGEIIHLLENFTWAEHCTKTELGSRLDAEITRLHDELSAPPAASAVPDGWKLVPKMPTIEMVQAAREHHEGDSYLPASLYRAMLAAAPSPDEGE